MDNERRDIRRKSTISKVDVGDLWFLQLRTDTAYKAHIRSGCNGRAPFRIQSRGEDKKVELKIDLSRTINSTARLSKKFNTHHGIRERKCQWWKTEWYNSIEEQCGAKKHLQNTSSQRKGVSIR